MSATGALEVAKAFEVNIIRPFGAPSLTRHDRDLRFIGEVFQTFAETMRSKSRATLSYRPQANGQQERSVKTMIQTVSVYVEDPLQEDWDHIAEKMVRAINNSRDSTIKETPFNLVHGWDAHSTLKAMTESIRRPPVKPGKEINSANPVMWRRESNTQREIALKLAKTYQVDEKARRAKEHNELLIPAERRKISRTYRPETTTKADRQDEEVDTPNETRFGEGD